MYFILWDFLSEYSSNVLENGETKMVNLTLTAHRKIQYKYAEKINWTKHKMYNEFIRN